MTMMGHSGGMSAIRRALRWAPRLRNSRAASGFLGGLALFVGLFLVANAVATAVWQDPITAVFTQADQKALSKELDQLEHASLPSSTLALVKNAGSEDRRMAVLAGHLRDTGAGEALGRIEVPRIDAGYVFVSGTGEKALKKGPGHYAGTALPGERGTVAIAGHRTTYEAPFRRLDRMHRGDEITLTMPYGRFSYSVEGSRVVSPSHVNVLRHVRHSRLVLTTCTPLFSAARRLIVTARLRRSTPRGAAAELTPLPPVAPFSAG
jgi:sortase A